MAKKATRGTVLETLASYTKRVEKFLPELEKRKIIFSTDVKVTPFREDYGVKKTPLVWPLWDYKMFYLVEVPAGTQIPKHAHDEAVFRLVVEGSLTVNGKEVRAGTWFVVNKYVPYEIATETGYKALGGYTSICQTNRQFARPGKRDLPFG